MAALPRPSPRRLIIGRRASAAERSITVGIYTGQQGDVVRKQIIPPFEAKNQCKVYTTQGVTLEQIALMRTSRNNPKYSVMFIDDIGVELAKREGLIEKLPREQIPNMERVLDRFVYYDGYGAAFAMSAAGLATTPTTGKPLASYGDLWDPQLKRPLPDGIAEGDAEPLSADRRRLGRNRQALRRNAIPDRAGLAEDGGAEAQRAEHLRKPDDGHAGGARARPISPASSIRRPSTPTRSKARRSICASRARAPLPASTRVTLVKNGPERELAIAFIN